MDLRTLRHVVTLARRLNYRKAAEDLGLTQSALSRSIQGVELRANVRLFDRGRSGVHPTPVGRAFVEQAAKLLRDADELDRTLNRMSAGAQGEISYGIAPLPASAMASAALCDGLIATPDLRSNVFVRRTDALLPLLIGEQIEFLVASEVHEHDARIRGVTLGRFPTSLIVRIGHPLLSKLSRQLDEFPLVSTGAVPIQAASAWKAKPHIVLDDHASLMRLIGASDCVWLSSAFAVADEIIEKRLALVPRSRWRSDSSTVHFRMMMYTLEGRSLSPAALRLKESFRARIRALSGLLSKYGG